VTPGLERLSVHEFLRTDVPVDAFLRACAAQGVGTVALLRSNVEAFGLDQTADLLQELGLAVSSYSSLGYWTTGRTHDGEPWSREDNVRQLDGAERLGAPLVVLGPGPLEAGDRDIRAARRRVAEGILDIWPEAASRGVRLAVEPLHPMMCPGRSVVTSLAYALDLVGPTPAEVVGVAIDSYHVWWDPDLERQVERSRGRIFAVHVDDYVQMATTDGRRRGLMGEGFIDLAHFRALVEAADFDGRYEVEVGNDVLSALPVEESIRRVVESYLRFTA
jgi:sugar phosphate isomerase/epimerase